ncbi:MAG: DNA-binding transcriptional LysR family regulator [Alteromonadaceae bacterium]|jgi:DNA-binding transcriptional LysR family regulator
MNSSFGFDLRMLEVFVATVKSGNMSTTAGILGTTQSAVSQSLSNLEKSLKVQLLDRSVRPIEVTTAGRFLYDSATQILSQARKTNHNILHANFKHLTHVKIAMVDSLATSFGPSLIESIKKHADKWSIATGMSHIHATALMSHKVDMIISDNALEEHEELVRHRILCEPFIIVTPKGYQGDVSNLNIISRKLDFIRYSATSLIGSTVERYLTRMKINAPHCLNLDNTFAILSSVTSGLGWTITTPLCLFKNGFNHDQFDCHPLPGDELFRNLILVTRQNDLWNLPLMLSQDIHSMLKNDFLAYINHELPWLKAKVKIA